MLNRMRIRYVGFPLHILLSEDMVKRFIVITCIVIMCFATRQPTDMLTLEDIARWIFLTWC